MILIKHVNFIKNSYFFDFGRLKHPFPSNITLFLLSSNIIFFRLGHPFFNPKIRISTWNLAPTKKLDIEKNENIIWTTFCSLFEDGTLDTSKTELMINLEKFQRETVNYENKIFIADLKKEPTMQWKN